MLSWLVHRAERVLIFCIQNRLKISWGSSELFHLDFWQEAFAKNPTVSFIIRSPKSRKIPKSVLPAVGLAAEASVPLLKLTDVDSEMEAAGLCHGVPRLSPGLLTFSLVLWEKTRWHWPQESETRAARNMKQLEAPHGTMTMSMPCSSCYSYFMDLHSIRLRRTYSTHSWAWEVDFCVNNELGVRNSLLLNTCAAAIFDNRNSWKSTLKRFERTYHECEFKCCDSVLLDSLIRNAFFDLSAQGHLPCHFLVGWVEVWLRCHRYCKYDRRVLHLGRLVICLHSGWVDVKDETKGFHQRLTLVGQTKINQRGVMKLNEIYKCCKSQMNSNVR